MATPSRVSPLLPPARRRSLQRRLLAWYRAHRRDLPWRRTRDPYAVWIAETMLQQTRVAAVVPYFVRFLQEFPDVKSLAEAPEDRVLARWSGLGYYTRARHLQRAARLVVERHGGRLPGDPNDLAALPGVGRYTLGAVLSIAFDAPWPVVDGNVARVLSRLGALAGDPRRAPAAGQLWEIAAALVPARAPGDFNQALMELGATVCAPRAPRCGECPVRRSCRAHAAGRPESYPSRRRRAGPRRVRALAAVVESGSAVWLERRAAGPNRGLYDLPAVESPGVGAAPSRRRLETHLAARGIRARAWREGGEFRHAILDRSYVVTLLCAHAPSARPADGGAWMPRGSLAEVPLAARARKAIRLLDDR